MTRVLVATVLGAALCAGCTMPVRTIPASPPPHVSQTLVVVLPGFGSDIDTLQQARVADFIRAALPHADVMLAGATVAFQLDGRIAQRLHQQVMVPARLQGYREIWLVGASMGGRAAMLYELKYPGEVAGLVLMAPLLDDRELVREIRVAGGLARWNPGPRPAGVSLDNAQRELWRMAKAWHRDPAQARRIWLVCGDDDWLLPAARLLAQALPPGHYLQPDGGHAWAVWSPAARTVLARSIPLRVASAPRLSR